VLKLSEGRVPVCHGGLQRSDKVVFGPPEDLGLIEISLYSYSSGGEIGEGIGGSQAEKIEKRPLQT
jgi:hypothetical protein